MTNQAIPEPAPYVLPAEIRRAVQFPTPGKSRLATLNVADCEALTAEFDRLTAENETLRADLDRRPLWCPECDAARLDNVSAGLEEARAYLGEQT